jgi:hypothetical protein
MGTLTEMEKELDRLLEFIKTLQRGEMNLDSESISWLRNFVTAAKLLPHEVLEKIFWVDDNPRIETVVALTRYAETKSEAMEARESGDIPKALILEQRCDEIYQRIPRFARW